MAALATIYLATNTVNGHAYVGVTRFSVESRWKRHLYNASRGLRTRLYSAIRKYGEDAFTVEAVASCLADPSAVERAVIRRIAPIYNQTNGGEFTAGRRLSAEAIAKIRSANIGSKRTPEQRVRASVIKREQYAARPGLRAAAAASLCAARSCIDQSVRLEAARRALSSRAWSAESRAKLSASCLGRRHSRGVLDRIAAKKRKPVECIELKAVFDSVSEAAEGMGLSVSGVSRVCRGTRASANGFTFQFVNC